MNTEVLGTRTAEESDRAVEAAVRILREGSPVALPTETVYGLAADALKSTAALKIFEAKERPRFDPLIVHLPSADSLPLVAAIQPEDQELVAALVERFWPGPLTLVLPRRDVVPDVVSAGLDTVAVRLSGHPVFNQIVQAFGKPLAAPSANRFGRISPTTAEHVRSELGGRIPLIVDAGPTQHGIESTIVAVRRGIVEILRPGPITTEQLGEFGIVTTAERTAQLQAPGQLPSHYAPRTPLVLTSDLRGFSVPENARAGALTLRGFESSAFAGVRTLSARGDLREAAANLFRSLRELDDAGVDLIVAEQVREEGLGHAIMDRLRRAAGVSSGARGTPE